MTRGRPKKIDQQHVVEVAMTLYWAEGLSVSLNEICRQAGIAKTSFYREFGSEDELMARAIDHYFDTFARPLIAALADDQPSASSLNGIITHILNKDNPQTPYGCMLVKMRDAPEEVGPQAKMRFEHCKKAQLAALERFVTRARSRGNIAPDNDVSLAAAYIDNQISNALTLKARGEPVDRIYHFASLSLSALFTINQRL